MSLGRLVNKGPFHPENLVLKIKEEPNLSCNDSMMEITKNKSKVPVNKPTESGTQNLMMNSVARQVEMEEDECLNLIKQHRKSFSDSGYSSCSSDNPSPEPRYFMESRSMNGDPDRICLTPGPQSKLQKLKKPEKQCHVCGENAHGNFFGAVVCLPCKTFFIRCTTEDASTFVCRQNDGNCDITGINRSRCKFCRFQKCLQHGMNRKERPEQVVIQEGQQLCKICGDVANGVHFGVISCEGCKKFFRRGLRESDSYVCKVGGKCTINPRTRNDCRYCRFERCMAVGMSTSAIKMGRPRKTTQEECMTVKTPPLEDVCEYIPNNQPETKMVYPPVSIPYMHPSFLQQFSAVAAVVPAVRKHQELNGSISNNSIQPARSLVMPNYSSPVVVPNSVTQNSVLPMKRPMIKEDYDISIPCKQLKTEANSYFHSPISTFYSANHITKTEESVLVVQSSPLEYDRKSRESVKTKVETNNMQFNSGDCVIVKEEVIDLNYEKASGHTTSPCTSKIADKPNLSNTETRVSDRSSEDGVLGHEYDSDYWNVLSQQYRQMSPMCESQQKLVSSLATAYLELIESFCKGAQISQDSNGEKETNLSQKRFIHYISAVINFMRATPGFSEVHDDDKYLILRLGAIQVCVILASIHLYNPVQHVFIKSFFDENLDPDHPTYIFQQALLNLAKTVHGFNLDNMEAAFLCALLSLATDWPNLKNPEKIEQIRNEVLCTMKSYISSGPNLNFSKALASQMVKFTGPEGYDACPVKKINTLEAKNQG